MTELSVILPTRDRAELLSFALESIVSQSLDRSLYEIIVVDNGSSASTRETVDQVATKSNYPIRYFKEQEPGLHNGRHRGAKEALSDLLVFCDDDIRACPTWLEAIRESFLEPSVVLVGGKNLPDYQVPPPAWVEGLWQHTRWGKALGYFSILDFGDEVAEIPPDYVWGCNFSIRRNVLTKVGGFHPDGMPPELIRYRGDGETAVSMAIRSLGCRAVYHPNAAVMHLVPASRMTMQYLYKRCFSQGISDSFSVLRRFSGGIGLTEATFLYRRIKQSVASALNGGRELMPEVRRTIRRGYWDGVAFHLREVQADPQLLEWVLKKDYWGDHD